MAIPHPSLLQVAAAAAGAQQYPGGALYVVATPIGNLADLSLRAIHVLSLVDVVACEDTRVTGVLLRHFGLDKPLLAAHEHNEQAAAENILARLARGERVAYVSDAGTPGVSDPGATLVAAVLAAGYRAVPLPGASSAVAALSVSGDAGARGFRFVGFLPTRAGERVQALHQAVQAGESCVFFEAPHRIESLVLALAQAAPARDVTLCRELTKQFETVVTMKASELPAWMGADPHRVRGEFVLVLHASDDKIADSEDADTDRTLRVLMHELPLKQAVALTVELTGGSRNELYQRALDLRKHLGEEAE